VRGSSCTVRQAVDVLEDSSKQARLFVMRHPDTAEELYGINSPFFNGFSVPKRTASYLLKRGYKPESCEWDP
jgi:hypothetical protein